MNKLLKDKYGITQDEEDTYALPTEEDYQILSTVKELENEDLSDFDRETLELIKTQLLDNWRDPLKEKLEKIQKKYASTFTKD